MEYLIAILTTTQEVGVWKETEWVYETTLNKLTRDGWRLFHVSAWIATDWNPYIHEAFVVFQRPVEGIELA